MTNDDPKGWYFYPTLTKIIFTCPQLNFTFSFYRSSKNLLIMLRCDTRRWCHFKITMTGILTFQKHSFMIMNILKDGNTALSRLQFLHPWLQIESMTSKDGIFKWRNGIYSKKRPLSKKTKNGFQERLSLNAGQKYCRMLQREHSAIHSLRSLFCLFLRGRFYTGFTVFTQSTFLSWCFTCQSTFNNFSFLSGRFPVFLGKPVLSRG